MCGLVSIIAKPGVSFTEPDLVLFETMLVFDTVRGKDSTGAFVVTEQGNVTIVKQAEQPYFMLMSEQWDRFTDKAINNGRILAGHNRAATQGSITNDNAHPFHVDNIVLMHNGTLEEGWQDSSNSGCDVDSHSIAQGLAEHPTREFLVTLSGAFALLWYDLETEKFHAVRNDLRPLYLVSTKDYDILVSEPWIGTVPLMRNGVTRPSVRLLHPGELVTWDLSGRRSVDHVLIPSVTKVFKSETPSRNRMFL